MTAGVAATGAIACGLWPMCSLNKTNLKYAACTCIRYERPTVPVDWIKWLVQVGTTIGNMQQANFSNDDINAVCKALVSIV